MCVLTNSSHASADLLLMRPGSGDWGVGSNSTTDGEFDSRHAGGFDVVVHKVQYYDSFYPVHPVYARHSKPLKSRSRIRRISNVSKTFEVRQHSNSNFVTSLIQT